jgi:hypothetical protein
MKPLFHAIAAAALAALSGEAAQRRLALSDAPIA